MPSDFLYFSPIAISAQEFASFIDNERLGLDGAKEQFERLRTINVFNLADENARLDAGQVAAIVLDLAREAGHARLADKILERLEANEMWQIQMIELEGLKSAVMEAKKTIEFEQTLADAKAFQQLARELGLSDAADPLAYEGELTHQKAAEILTERIARKEGARVAALLKREIFDKALIREEPLKDWNIKTIKQGIEISKIKAISSSDVLSERVQRLGKEILEHDLNQWVKNAPAGEDRAMASDRIVVCATQRFERLDLSGLGLTSLPKIVGSLTQLQALNVYNNRLESLPESIWSLTQLQALNVTANRLESLPHSIGQLAQLKRLFVSNNHLRSLPDSIGQLGQLKRLYVPDNQLRSLPNSIGQLGQLEQLVVSVNQLHSLPESIGLLSRLTTLTLSNNQLSSLPDSILALPDFCTVRIYNNPLSDTALDWLQERIAQPEDHGPTIRFVMAHTAVVAEERALEEIIGDWYKDDPKESKFYRLKEEWKKLQSEPDANSFGILLTKLQTTLDYQNIQTRPLLKERVIAILERVLEDQELRGHCFSLADAAVSSCDDNVSLGLNNLEMAVVAHRASKGEFNEEQLLKFGRGMFRMELLRLIALNKIKSLQLVDPVEVDDVEVVLAYQVGLRQPLDLPVQTQAMLFGRISGVTEQDLVAAREMVLAAEEGKELPEFLAKEKVTLLEFLAGWSPWQQHLQREYSSRFAEISERFGERMNELQERVESQEIDEGTYHRESDRLPKELEQARLVLYKELSKEKLSAARS